MTTTDNAAALLERMIQLHDCECPDEETNQWNALFRAKLIQLRVRLEQDRKELIEKAGRIVEELEAKSKLAHENGEKEFATAQKMTDEKGRKLFGKLASHYYGARDAYADAITIVRQQLGEEKAQGAQQGA